MINKITLLVLGITLCISLAKAQLIEEANNQYFHHNKSLSINFEYAIGNFIKVSTGNESKNFSGFLLGGLGIEKHLPKDFSLYFRSSMITDFIIPFPAPFDCEGYCENGGALAFALGTRKTFKLNQMSGFAVGLGLSSNYYFWNLNNDGYDSLFQTATFSRFTNLAFGGNLDVHYIRKFSDNKNNYGLGLSYSPTFINSKSISSAYLHTIYFKLLYNLSIHKKETVAHGRHWIKV